MFEAVTDILDPDVVHHPATWLFIIGGIFAFGLGFKGASNGLFGVATTEAAVGGFPIWMKAAIILTWPVVVYIFMKWKMSR